jgi:hypothetical protein
VENDIETERGIVILSLNFILFVKVCALDRENRVS